jgi:hypothetical protein
MDELLTHKEFSSRGGRARRENLSKAERREAGRAAIRVRWERYRADVAAGRVVPADRQSKIQPPGFKKLKRGRPPVQEKEIAHAPAT